MIQISFPAVFPAATLLRPYHALSIINYPEAEMLTLEDCIELCGLTQEDIRYIMEHEHVSELRAAALAEQYVVLDESGTPHLDRRIIADIATLKQRPDLHGSAELEAFVRDFVLTHPNLERLYS